MSHPLVGIVMGSQSDWQTMSQAAEILEALDVPHECRIVHNQYFRHLCFTSFPGSFLFQSYINFNLMV